MVTQLVALWFHTSSAVDLMPALGLCVWSLCLLPLFVGVCMPVSSHSACSLADLLSVNCPQCVCVRTSPMRGVSRDRHQDHWNPELDVWFRGNNEWVKAWQNHQTKWFILLYSRLSSLLGENKYILQQKTQLTERQLKSVHSHYQKQRTALSKYSEKSVRTQTHTHGSYRNYNIFMRLLFFIRSLIRQERWWDNTILVSLVLRCMIEYEIKGYPLTPILHIYIYRHCSFNRK